MTKKYCSLKTVYKNDNILVQAIPCKLRPGSKSNWGISFHGFLQHINKQLLPSTSSEMIIMNIEDFRTSHRMFTMPHFYQ